MFANRRFLALFVALLGALALAGCGGETGGGGECSGHNGTCNPAAPNCCAGLTCFPDGQGSGFCD